MKKKQFGLIQKIREYSAFDAFVGTKCGLFVYFCFVFITACGEDRRRQSTIDTRIKERVEDFRIKKLKECSNQALDIATTNADSILLKNADLWQIKGDNIPRPPRPIKPGEPNITIKIDTTPAKPLF